MAKATLPTNYKDDIMATQMGGLRRYRPIQNDDGTVSFEDVTDYTQVGSNFGAAQMNQTNTAVNNSADKSKIIDSLADVAANTQEGMMAGALAVRELNGNMQILEKHDAYIPSGDVDQVPSNNFLAINLTDRYGKGNECTYFYQEKDNAIADAPAELNGQEFIGYREVYRYSQSHILVRLIEFFPIQGRIWTRFYNVGSWSEWKSVTPQ